MSDELDVSIDPDAADRGELRTLLDGAPLAPAHARAAVVSDPLRDVIIPEGIHSKTALLVFTGANDALTMPVPVFDRYLIPLDITPIYFCDFNRLHYMAGIRSISESYQGTIDCLRGMLHDMGFTRLYAFGNCAGASAAIRYGIDLKAERIIAFDVLSHISDHAVATFEHGHTFMRNRFSARFSLETADLRPFLQTRKSDAPISLFYYGGNELKRAHAERLGDIHGVYLHSLDCPRNQGLLRRFVLSNENFSQWLADILAVHPMTDLRIPDIKNIQQVPQR